MQLPTQLFIYSSLDEHNTLTKQSNCNSWKIKATRALVFQSGQAVGLLAMPCKYAYIHMSTRKPVSTNCSFPLTQVKEVSTLREMKPKVNRSARDCSHHIALNAMYKKNDALETPYQESASKAHYKNDSTINTLWKENEWHHTHLIHSSFFFYHLPTQPAPSTHP